VWQDAAFDGGQPVQEYRVWTDQATGTWKVLKTLNVKSLVVTGLTPGSRYSFKVQARNSIGYSADSNTITALAAIVPNKPLSPSTYLQVNSVIAKWTAPTTNSLQQYGSEIQGYRVSFRWADGTYSELMDHCDGSLPEILAATQCEIPLSALMASPFSLTVG
jgi:hypothetical protein